MNARPNLRIRIVVQLIDASHGRHIWADRFDSDLDDVFAIQGEYKRTSTWSASPPTPSR
jgi:adenylate cyclase